VSRPPAPPVADLPVALDVASSGCAGTGTSDLRRLFCTPARPGANLPGSGRRRFLSSTGGEPPTRIGCCALPLDRRLTLQLALASHPPARPRPTLRLAAAADLQLGWLNTLRFAPDGIAASSLRLLLPQPPAFTGCCPHFSPNRRRTSDSRRLSHPPALPVSIHVGLRLVPLPPAGLLVHP